MENEDQGRATDLGQVGSELARIYRNFDVRYYDKKGGGKYRYLKEFVSDLRSIRLDSNGDNRIYVSIKNK